MARAPSVCSTAGCPNTAVTGGRCPAHQRKPWARRSPSSAALNGHGRTAHRAARRTAAARANGRCETCGQATTALQLHHPAPLSQGGAIVQPDALMLCTDCHRDADRQAGARR
ncbi:MAG: HNH endonuclease [Solirubrobacteraceae bacterium]